MWLPAIVLTSSALENMAQEPGTKDAWDSEKDAGSTYLVGTVGTPRVHGTFRDPWNILISIKFRRKKTNFWVEENIFI